MMLLKVPKRRNRRRSDEISWLAKGEKKDMYLFNHYRFPPLAYSYHKLGIVSAIVLLHLHFGCKYMCHNLLSNKY